ncbi:unnamed protein product [Staurois parvus]|uniref:Transposase Tc1-like domain-containing protein n=1 Tax=Staurois parvus TaxID=386267 RepID=A0ABN9DUR3_9NEOB|nr:unnamed protein product [Staurois parvus]
MQTAFTNICERMGHSKELNEFKRGTVIGCHLCNKSIRDIFLLLNIPRSTVSGIITKWKQLGIPETQPQSDRQRMTERGQRMLKRTVRRSCQLSAESIAKDFQTLYGLQISITVHRELHGMGFHGRTAKCNAKRQMQWCKPHHHWTFKQWRHVLWSDQSRVSVWQSNACVWVWRLPGE